MLVYIYEGDTWSQILVLLNGTGYCTKESSTHIQFYEHNLMFKKHCLVLEFSLFMLVLTTDQF